MLFDFGKVELHLLHVERVCLEEHVLHAEQQDRLNKKLKPLALPVLEGSAEELRPELVHGKGLPVLVRFIADLDEHRDELAGL